jgi:PmbA protein
MAATDPLDLLGDLVSRARTAGAEAADAVLIDSVSLSVGMRLGALERLERSEGGDVGLRVLIGRRQAFVSSSDRSPAALSTLVERAVAMARLVPEDPYCGLADPGQVAHDVPDLDLADATEPVPEQLIDLAARAEDAARAPAGITNSEGADAAWGRSEIALVGSNGLAFRYAVTNSSLSVGVLAGDGAQGLDRDHDYTSAARYADLRRPEDVGAEAARRALRRLGSRKMPTCAVPVVFDPRVARGLISSLVGAINGASVARGTTFLKDKMGERIFAPGIRIVDDPHRRRGLRSRPCDGEGLPTRPIALIDDGILTTWLLDLRSARQLGLAPTGHASRSTGGPPSPSASNVHLDAGAITAAEMIGDIPDGFYVTDLFGQGVNLVTGDFSRGAAGLWIKGGELAFPVSEVTVAGTLPEMFRTLTPASDLERRFGIDAPTVRIDGLTIAGR